jgi:hypothetical protein
VSQSDPLPDDISSGESAPVVIFGGGPGSGINYPLGNNNLIVNAGFDLVENPFNDGPETTAKTEIYTGVVFGSAFVSNFNGGVQLNTNLNAHTAGARICLGVQPPRYPSIDYSRNRP